MMDVSADFRYRYLQAAYFYIFCALEGSCLELSSNFKLSSRTSWYRAVAQVDVDHCCGVA
jgi:hypothetical protein